MADMTGSTEEQGFSEEHRQARIEAFTILNDDSLDSVTAMRQAADVIEPHEPETARKWRDATEVGEGNPVDYRGEPMPLADALMHIGGDLHRLAGTLKHEADTVERAGEDAGEKGMSETEEATGESAEEQREAAEAVEAAAEAVEEAADDQREAAETAAEEATEEAVKEAVETIEDEETAERIEEGNPFWVASEDTGQTWGYFASRDDAQQVMDLMGDLPDDAKVVTQDEAERIRSGNPITPEGETVVGEAPRPEPTTEPAPPPAEAVQHSAEADTPPDSGHWLTRPILKIRTGD